MLLTLSWVYWLTELYSAQLCYHSSTLPTYEALSEEKSSQYLLIDANYGHHHLVSAQFERTIKTLIKRRLRQRVVVSQN